MSLLVSLADLRDVVIVVWGVISAIFFLIGIVIAALVGISLRKLFQKVHVLMDDDVKPTLESVKDAAETVRGTTEYASRTVVIPIAEAYATVAGVKRALSVFGKVRGR